MAKKEFIKKTILNALLVGVSVFGGFFTFLFGLFSIYGIEFLVIFALFMLLMFVLVNGRKKKRFLKWAASILTLGILVMIGMIGYEEYQRSIPVVSDRTTMIHAYLPFEENTKAILLDEKSDLSFTYEEGASIRIDGATALYPVYASFVRNVFEPTDEYYHYGKDKDCTLMCTGTGDAFESLISGEADLIFCAKPSEKQLAAAEEAGVQLHLTEIGKEAFVFFVNSKNPIDGLTVDEIQGIYTGEFTNWKQLGGKNKEILPYQREEGSGSQTAMLSFMKGLELIEPKTEEVVDSMGGIIDQVADYRNHVGAIGYTFRFYSNDMVGTDQIKLLKLNGIEANKETIRNGQYPITDCFYAITASKIGEPAPEETDLNLKQLIEWIKGAQGQKIIDEVGYVSIY